MDIQTDTALNACAGLDTMLAKPPNVYERAIEARHFHAAGLASGASAVPGGGHLRRRALGRPAAGQDDK